MAEDPKREDQTPARPGQADQDPEEPASSSASGDGPDEPVKRDAHAVSGEKKAESDDAPVDEEAESDDPHDDEATASGDTPAGEATGSGGSEPDSGMHMLGVLPEREVIEAEEELSPQEEAILKDLEDSLPAEDRETAEDAQRPAETSASPAPEEKAEKKPSVLGQLFYWGGAALLLFLGGRKLLDGMDWLGLLQVAVGLYFIWVSTEPWRKKAKADRASDAAPDSQFATTEASLSKKE